MFEVDDKYIAGYLDGEGTISIRKSHYSYKGIKHLQLNAAVEMTNSDLRSLKIIRSHLGYGRIIKHIPSKNGFQPIKQCYRLIINTQENIMDFLMRVSNHLLIKKEQAINVMCFLARRIAKPRGFEFGDIRCYMDVWRLNHA